MVERAKELLETTDLSIDQAERRGPGREPPSPAASSLAPLLDG
jgi:hypothetical protein